MVLRRQTKLRRQLFSRPLFFWAYSYSLGVVVKLRVKKRICQRVTVFLSLNNITKNNNTMNAIPAGTIQILFQSDILLTV